MLITGTFMACTWGSKVNGILTVVAVGIAVSIDLWGILDKKRTPNVDHFWRHFSARVIGFIIVPFFFYLSFFYIHFAILTKSGTGDTFMSPQFQETLAGNDMLMSSEGSSNTSSCQVTLKLFIEIRYYDTLTLRHKDSKVFLHSHVDKYPLKYEDGRVSSQGIFSFTLGEAKANALHRPASYWLRT